MKRIIYFNKISLQLYNHINVTKRIQLSIRIVAQSRVTLTWRTCSKHKITAVQFARMQRNNPERTFKDPLSIKTALKRGCELRTSQLAVFYRSPTSVFH